MLPQENSQILKDFLDRTFLKHRAQQQSCKIYIGQINDPEYADIDDPESIIISFNAQIEKIRRMCINIPDGNAQENETISQYEFDFPSGRTIKEIIENLRLSIITKLVPTELVMNPLIFLFMDKILQSPVLQKDESIVNEVCSLYISLTLYDYFELMNSIIAKYRLFLLNNSNGEIAIYETEREMYILAISNLLIDENSRAKLITLGIHDIIFQTLIHLPITSSLFHRCINYFTNLAFFLKPDEKNNQLFKDLVHFLINNITSNFPLKLSQNVPNDNENNCDENQLISVLISELKVLSILLEELILIEYGLSNGLENCVNVLLNLANSGYQYYCISEHLFEILRLISINGNQLQMFSSLNFFDVFFNIYKKSSINAKIQGIELLIILIPLISENESFFKSILQNFKDTEFDNNYEYWEHVCFFIIAFLNNVPASKRRNFVCEIIVEFFKDALETRLFVNQILKLLFISKQSDPDFWNNFLITNDFYSIISDFNVCDFDEFDQEDQESIQLIKLFIDE